MPRATTDVVQRHGFRHDEREQITRPDARGQHRAQLAPSRSGAESERALRVRRMPTEQPHRPGDGVASVELGIEPDVDTLAVARRRDELDRGHDDAAEPLGFTLSTGRLDDARARRSDGTRHADHQFPDDPDVVSERHCIARPESSIEAAPVGAPVPRSSTPFRRSPARSRIRAYWVDPRLVVQERMPRTGADAGVVRLAGVV